MHSVRRQIMTGRIAVRFDRTMSYARPDIGENLQLPTPAVDRASHLRRVWSGGIWRFLSP
jgi:hypothetical protein